MSRVYSTKKKKIVMSNGTTIEKYYAYAVSNELVNSKEIAKEIQESTTLTKADVVAAMQALSDIIAKKLSMGYNVKIDGIGTFSISAKSAGFDSAVKVKPSAVKFSKISYRADAKLRKVLSDVKFERQNDKIPKGLQN